MAQKIDRQESRIEGAANVGATAPSSTTEKLEALEGQVRETLQETRSSVEEIVTNVKETVQETVGTVKETVEQAKSTVDTLVENVSETIDSTTTAVRQSFDLQYQVNHRPWLMFGGAVLTGYLVGGWTQSDMPHRRYYRNLGTSYNEDDNLYAAAMSGGATLEDLEGQSEETKKGYAYPSHQPQAARGQSQSAAFYEQSLPVHQGLREQFQDEWNIVKGVALDVIMGTLRTMVRQQMPSLSPHIDNVFDRISVKLASEPQKPSHGQEYGRGATQAAAPENSTSYTATSATPSTSQPSSADRPSTINPQPRPYMQYRR
jgi:ElaB/YqjD/DUF883 family membrane-anchored ribosome-binding protein